MLLCLTLSSVAEWKLAKIITFKSLYYKKYGRSKLKTANRTQTNKKIFVCMHVCMYIRICFNSEVFFYRCFKNLIHLALKNNLATCIHFRFSNGKSGSFNSAYCSYVGKQEPL